MTNDEWLNTLSNEEHARVTEMILAYAKLGVPRETALTHIRNLLRAG